MKRYYASYTAQNPITFLLDVILPFAVQINASELFLDAIYFHLALDVVNSQKFVCSAAFLLYNFELSNGSEVSLISRVCIYLEKANFTSNCLLFLFKKATMPITHVLRL